MDAAHREDAAVRLSEVILRHAAICIPRQPYVIDRSNVMLDSEPKRLVEAKIRSAGTPAFPECCCSLVARGYGCLRP